MYGKKSRQYQAAKQHLIEEDGIAAPTHDQIVRQMKKQHVRTHQPRSARSPRHSLRRRAAVNS